MNNRQEITKEAKKIVALARETIGCATSPEVLSTLAIENTTYYLVGFNTSSQQVIANPTLAKYPSFVYRQEVNGRPTEMVRLRPPPVTIYMSVSGNDITLDEDVDIPDTMCRVIEGKLLHLIYDPLSGIILVSVGRTLHPIDTFRFIDMSDRNIAVIQEKLSKKKVACSVSMVLHYSRYVAHTYLGEDSVYVVDTCGVKSSKFKYPPEIERSELLTATQRDAFVISSPDCRANIVLRHSATRNRTFQIAPKYGVRSFCISEEDIRETLSQLYLASTYYSKDFKREEGFNTRIYSMIPTMFDNETLRDTFPADRLKYTNAVGKTFSCTLPHAEFYDETTVVDLEAELMELLVNLDVLRREGYELTCVKRALANYDTRDETFAKAVRLRIRGTFVSLVVTACMSSPHSAAKIREKALELLQRREEVLEFAITAYENEWVPSEKRHREMHRILTTARDIFVPKRPDEDVAEIISILIYNEAPKTFANIDLQRLTAEFEDQ